jgi:hypothetical protein
MLPPRTIAEHITPATRAIGITVARTTRRNARAHKFATKKGGQRPPFSCLKNNR